MKRLFLIPIPVLGLLLATLAAPTLQADEGLWLFNNFPKQDVQKKYGVQITDEFLKHLQLSAVRFNSGGTGSFVSPNGLLFTNHHVGADCVHKLSTADNDYIKNGFYANSFAEEKKCPDLEVNVLLNIKDVTSKVTAGVTPQTSAADANRMKKAAMSAIEKECSAATGNRCDVVTFYSGGQYNLYEYKKYTDIRLVFAPEFAIAFFGGDEENFTYPRYDLDITFFRAYENDKPVTVTNYFKWSKQGAKDGELVFTSGNPGTTGRLMTVTELEFSGSKSYPLNLKRLNALIVAVQQYMGQGPEQARVAGDLLFGLQNSFKATTGFQSGLTDPELMSMKRAKEKEFRSKLAQDPAQAGKFGPLYDELATAYANLATYYADLFLFENSAAMGSDLLRTARQVARYSVETKKPDADRLREYAAAGLPSLEQRMYSTAPITPSLEEVVLAEYFRFLVAELGAANPTVAKILNGKTPQEAAKYYVANTKLMDVSERKRLANDPEAVKNSRDSMIQLALILDGPARANRKKYEDGVESLVTRAKSQIALAQFSLSGGNDYPDATFTLRISYGSVKGYTDEKGQQVPWDTDFAGLFAKNTGKDPFAVPQSWLKAKDKLNLKTPFNFVATCDIHGGNSGSATLNTKGEVVGIVFDGNIESLPNRFVFTDKRARSVHVASQGIAAALDKVYGAKRVLQELGF